MVEHEIAGTFHFHGSPSSSLLHALPKFARKWKSLQNLQKNPECPYLEVTCVNKTWRVLGSSQAGFAQVGSVCSGGTTTGATPGQGKHMMPIGHCQQRPCVSVKMKSRVCASPETTKQPSKAATAKNNPNLSVEAGTFGNFQFTQIIFHDALFVWGWSVFSITVCRTIKTELISATDGRWSFIRESYQAVVVVVLLQKSIKKTPNDVIASRPTFSSVRVRTAVKQRST